MGKPGKERAKARNFTAAFERMVNFVAIAKTKDPAETLKQLVLQCFVILSEEDLSSPRGIQQALDALFGLVISNAEIDDALRALTEIGAITVVSGRIALAPTAKTLIESRIAEARSLEDKVRADWFAEVKLSAPTLPTDQLWQALRKFLGRAFRRHGMQTVALLDPEADVDPAYQESLSTILRTTVAEVFEVAHSGDVSTAISGFMAAAAIEVSRAQYIAQLADGAFNYFSLTISPEIAEQMKGQLQPLVLFLDTNFQFGVLDLHNNTQVEVSVELLQATREHKLPIKFRYHEATSHEMDATLSFYGGILRSRHWPRALSRAASSSRKLSGIELKYHELNAQSALQVEDFLAPLSHWQELLAEHGIDIYRVPDPQGSLQLRADLEAEYRKFLNRHNRQKPQEAIQHDMAVLATARKLRSEFKTTLAAGALFVTCDYYLYWFDREWSKNRKVPTCVVLPNLLWQILRRYVPTDRDFDASFVETFALPEFSTIGSGAARAASKMLSILAAYKDVPEHTAMRLLSNDLLIDQLRVQETDEQFDRLVESAIVSDNASLQEENAALQRQLEAEQKERAAKETEADRAMASAAKAAAAKQREAEEVKRRYDEQALEIAEIQRQREAERLDQETVQAALQAEKHARNEAHLAAVRNQRAQRAAEDKLASRSKLFALIAAVLLVLVFELAVHAVDWRWLIDHPQGYGLQFSFSAVLACVVAGVVHRPWWKWCVGVGAFGFLFVVAQIIGGKSMQVQ